MSAEIIKQLLLAHTNRDDALFRKTAYQLAANESKSGHARVAEELRAIIARLPEVSSKEASGAVDIAQPRGELRELMDGGFREEKLRDIILDESTRQVLDRIISENRLRSQLESWGVHATRRLLFYGPPGCGKTLAAKVISGELGLPLMTIRFDGLFSRFLGATASHLRQIFEEMPKRPAVYFFDEFDAIGKNRGDEQDIGEVRRVVSSFLQLMDANQSHSLIIAATNFEESIDSAAVRRFDSSLEFHLPKRKEIEAIIELRLGSFKLDAATLRSVSSKAKDLSFADAAKACDFAIRSMALAQRSKLTSEDLSQGFSAIANSALIPHRSVKSHSTRK